jgi:hypothetical protein
VLSKDEAKEGWECTRCCSNDQEEQLRELIVALTRVWKRLIEAIITCSGAGDDEQSSEPATTDTIPSMTPRANVEDDDGDHDGDDGGEDGDWGDGDDCSEEKMRRSRVGQLRRRSSDVSREVWARAANFPRLNKRC